MWVGCDRTYNKPKDEVFNLNEGIKSESREMLQNVVWNTGAVKYVYPTTSLSFY